MKRVTNCILLDPARKEVLLLKKPSRGWWVAPGGKMEKTETIGESVRREYREETGLILVQPRLRGVSTIVVQDGGHVLEEWMLFTFFSDRYEGGPLRASPEGTLSWHPVGRIAQLHKPDGDQIIFEHVLNHTDVLSMRFRYTPDYKLIRADQG